jgi:hypothetical protein
VQLFGTKGQKFHHSPVQGTTGQAKNLAKGRVRAGTAKIQDVTQVKARLSLKGRSKTEKGCSETEKDVLKQEKMF